MQEQENHIPSFFPEEIQRFERTVFNVGWDDIDINSFADIKDRVSNYSYDPKEADEARQIACRDSRKCTKITLDDFLASFRSQFLATNPEAEKKALEPQTFKSFLNRVVVFDETFFMQALLRLIVTFTKLRATQLVDKEGLLPQNCFFRIGCFLSHRALVSRTDIKHKVFFHREAIPRILHNLYTYYRSEDFEIPRPEKCTFTYEYFKGQPVVDAIDPLIREFFRRLGWDVFSEARFPCVPNLAPSDTVETLLSAGLEGKRRELEQASVESPSSSSPSRKRKEQEPVYTVAEAWEKDKAQD